MSLIQREVTGKYKVTLNTSEKYHQKRESINRDRSKSMWSECLLVWLQCVALLGAFYTYNKTESKGRRQEGAGRFLNLFSVVRC